MLVSITSPRHGAGRTLLSILLAMRMHAVTSTKQVESKINLVDLNKNKDANYYLQEYPMGLGFDQFGSAMEAEILTSKEAFLRKCSQETKAGLRLTEAPTEGQYVINKVRANDFIKFAREEFNHIFVDAGVGGDKESTYFFSKSDFVVVVLEEDARSIDLIKHDLRLMYKGLERKLVFVVNKCVQEINIDMRAELLQAGFNNMVFMLPFSIPLVNDANDKALINFVNKKVDAEVIDIVDDINAYLLGL